MRFETRAIYEGQQADPQTGAATVPIYQTSTFKQDAIGKTREYEYSRSGNPARDALEKAIAGLEGCKHGLAFASGLAAENAALSIQKPGDRIAASTDTYGGTYRAIHHP